MLYYKVEMGEGFAGPLTTVSAITTSLYSCIGIAMINEKTQLGGLYHYPSGRLSRPEVTLAIIAMINHINPSTIYVTAAKAMVPGMGSPEDDVKAVVEFLEKNAPHAKIEKPVARSWANYFWGGTLKINEPHPSGEDGGRAEVTSAFEDHYQAGPRPLGNNVSYFGANCEKNKKILP